MTILEDTRNQKAKHELKHQHFASNGVILTRSKIVVGDYCKPPEVSVDTKANIAEIAQNIGGGKDEHQRFIRELKLAYELKCKLYILIETQHLWREAVWKENGNSALAYLIDLRLKMRDRTNKEKMRRGK